MNRKHTMSDEAARALIGEIRQRCRGYAGNYEYYDDPDAVCEIVEATLLGLGYNPSWVVSPFSDMLRKDVQQHKATVRLEKEAVLEKRKESGPPGRSKWFSLERKL